MVGAVVFTWSDTLAHEDEEGESLASTTVALVESLRRRGIRVGVVGAGELGRYGLEQEVQALDDGDPGEAARALSVEPDDVVFVSASGAAIAAAARAGITTVQAMWFRADEHEEDGEPDFLAFTQMDVLNVVERLARE